MQFFILNRYVPAQLQMAVQEMDEIHLSKFSFHNRDGILQVFVTFLNILYCTTLAYYNDLFLDNQPGWF